MNANVTTYTEAMSHSPAISQRSQTTTSPGLGKGEDALLKDSSAVTRGLSMNW